MISPETYKIINEMYENHVQKMNILNLANFSIFSNINFDLIKRLYSFMTKFELRKNSIIYKEGDKPENLYFIFDGKVEVKYPYFLK